MSYSNDYANPPPARADLDAAPGTVLLEFGTPWCGHCRAAQPALQALLEGREGVTHLKVEDGKGRPPGRAFAVRLWPTLVLLRGGEEQARVVRPVSGADLAPLEQAVDGQGASPSDAADE